jgi:hypothetical protein
MGSDGGGGSGNPALLLQGGTPMPGLPVAGKDSNIGDPYDYGKFQNFLPDIPAEGRAPSATGLRPDMFKYRSPSGIIDPGSNSGDSSGGSGDVTGQIKDLRDQLAKLTAGGGGDGSGAPQTMGMGGGGGSNNYAGPGAEGGGMWRGTQPAAANFIPGQDGGRHGFFGLEIPPIGGSPTGMPTDWRAKDAAAAAAAAEAAKKTTAGA